MRKTFFFKLTNPTPKTCVGKQTVENNSVHSISDVVFLYYGHGRTVGSSTGY